MSSRFAVTCHLFLWVLLASVCLGESGWPGPTDKWETIGPPEGTLLIHGGHYGGQGADCFMSLLADPEALIVVIPTAAADEDCGNNAPAAMALRERGANSVVVLHTRERSLANSPDFVAPLRRSKAVWISGGQQSRLAKAYLHTLLHRELFALLARGGLLAGNSAGASIQGSFLYGGHSAGDVGFGLVRNSAIGQHYIRRRRMGGLVRILQQSPQLLGIGIDEGAFILVRGNTFEVCGNSKVAVCNAQRPGWPGEQPYELLLPGDKYDLLSRRSLRATTPDPDKLWKGARQEWSSPASQWRTIGPPKGTLLMSGPQPGPEIMDRFLKLAGGPDARIVVIPTAFAENADQHGGDLLRLKELGAKNITLWHTIDRDAANSTEFVAPLRQADAVWICGGEQWRLADAYLHTLAHKELFDLLERGGVIAAADAGSRFLASHMAGDPYGWDHGCGFLRQAAVHTWPAANRGTDELLAILKQNRPLLGIGIDDHTAVVVQGNQMSVIGDGKVAVLDATRPGWPWEEDEEPYLLLGHGETYDLKTRRPDW